MGGNVGRMGGNVGASKLARHTPHVLTPAATRQGRLCFLEAAVEEVIEFAEHTLAVFDGTFGAEDEL